MTILKRTAQDFFDHEYLDYAHYTIAHRAIPSAIDGFKPTQRKVAHAASKYWKTGNEKPLKVFQLAGNVAATTFYHHGGASLEAAIIAMTQDFKNSMPIFQGIGQFGSLRSPEAGAPRYVSVKFNENFWKLYKDFDLTTSQTEEGEEIEPKFFLPIIPTVLLNGGSGIAVGFATNILNRNPIDLIDACLGILQDKPVKRLIPWIRGFNGTFTVDLSNSKSWTIKGQCKVVNTSTVEVTEVPPSYTYEKYENHLNNLLEKGIISSYDDLSTGNSRYIVKFTRQKLAELQEKGKLEDVLKLSEREMENLTTLDESGNLKIFDSVEDIVRYFVEFRLKYFDLRKEMLIKTLGDELQILSNSSRFIQLVVDGEVELAGVPRSDIESKLEENLIERIDGKYEYLLSMRVSTLTKEKFEDLKRRESEKLNLLEKVKSTTPRQFFIDDLKELRSKMIKSESSK